MPNIVKQLRKLLDSDRAMCLLCDAITVLAALALTVFLFNAFR